MIPTLVGADGRPLALDGRRWVGAADPVDDRILADVTGPVLDIGCGPGRHVVALSELGIPTLGIDVTPAALAQARARGASVLRRCVFDRVPGAGRWRSALLLDGNLGIGGDPVTLLTRVRDLLAPGGRVLVEVSGSDTPRYAGAVRFSGLEAEPTSVSPWFQWSTVTVDDLGGIARAARVRANRVRYEHGRWFAWLDR